MDKSNFHQLIAENRLDEAIRALLALTQGTHRHQDALLLSAQYNEYKNLQIRGTESSAELDRRRNKIAHALLQLVDELPDNTGTATPTPTPPAPPTTGPDTGRLPSKMPFWFSVGAFAVLLAISLFVPGWAQQNNALSKTLLALAAAGVAATLPGFLNLEFNNFLKAGGALAVFVLVFLINPAREEVSTALAVQVRAQPPSANYPPLKNVELEIWNKNEWLKGKFSEEGVADFKNLPAELSGQTVALRWKAEYYRPAKDSLLISPPSVTLDFVPDGSLEKVSGSVQDAQGHFLADVIVRVEGIADTTNAFGLFQLSIPAERQKEKYRLVATKTGYAPWENLFSPTAGQEAPIVLMKSK